MDSQILLKMYQEYGENGKILIIKNGYLLSHYDQSILKKDFHHIHSCTKSMVSALLGRAIAEGYVQNVSQKVVEFFPDYNKFNPDERKNSMTLYHLLTMSSGMQWSDKPNIDSIQMNQSADWAQYILERPLAEYPGQVWNYNSGGSQLLSIILQKATGLSAADYAKNTVFPALGITHFQWWSDPQGHSVAGWGLHLSTYDIAKLAYLMLREGVWNRQQLIPASWIRESTQNHFSVDSNFGRGWGYGYQWWVYTDLPWQAYKAWGSFGKHAVMMIVVPDQDLVVVLAGNINNDKKLLKEYILASIASDRLTQKPPNAAIEWEYYFKNLPNDLEN